MLAPILPNAYDVAGRPVPKPGRRRWRPTFPMGRYVSQPLSVRCADLEDLRRFLAGCRYVSDQEQFGRADYWAPPEVFERTRQGDCDDYALWTWRQMMTLGHPAARFVVGPCGRYGEGHAWVTARIHGTDCLVEPQMAAAGLRLPRLFGVGYSPRYSVAWDGEHISYFEHETREWNPPIAELVVEWAPSCRIGSRVGRTLAARGLRLAKTAMMRVSASPERGSGGAQGRQVRRLRDRLTQSPEDTVQRGER